MIANMPMAINPIAKVVSAMSMIQSSPVDIAARTQARLFALYVVVLVIGGLAAAFLTVLVYRANNAYQEAIKADADARISGSNAEAKRAGESAGKANERAQALEHDNLGLRGQVATLETAATDAKKGLAGLQKTAADAKAAQQRVETDLAKQQERAAKAEIALLELQKDVAWRRLKSQTVTARKLKRFTGIELLTVCLNEPEPLSIARLLVGTGITAGWKSVSFTQSPNPIGNERGVFFEGIVVQSNTISRDPGDFSRLAAITLAVELNEQGIDADVEPVDPELPPKTIRIVIGRKPTLIDLPDTLRSSAEARKKQRMDRLRFLLENNERIFQNWKRQNP